MNKDFDERLVPNGEYRDALNIEVSTSENEEVGTVQNIKGNAQVTQAHAGQAGVTFMGTSISNNAITVGSHADEASKTIFNFIHKASDLAVDGSYATGVRYTGVISDVISEWKPSQVSETGDTYPLVVDVFEVRSEADIQDSQDGIITNVDKDTIAATAFNNDSVNLYVPKGIRKGMRVQLVGPDGFDIYAGQDIRVNGVSSTLDSNADVVVTTTIPTGDIFYNQELKDSGFVFKFTSDRILNFKLGSTESESNVTGTPSSNTPSHTTITGINFEDDILFFTDGRTEPKRIVIEHFKDKQSQLPSTTSIHRHSFIRYTLKDGTEVAGLLEEKHITVIRPNPLEPPVINPIFTKRKPVPISQGFGAMFGAEIPSYITYVDSVISPVLKINDLEGSSAAVGDEMGLPFSFVDESEGVLNQLMSPGTSFFIESSVHRVNWREGDVLELTGAESGAVVTCQIIETFNTILSANSDDFSVFKIELLDVPSTYFVDEEVLDDDGVGTGSFNQIVPFGDETWIASLREKDAIYPERFLYFAYRYKYANNEHSCISPYSRAVFQPGIYAYNSVSGFNNGMVNKLKSVEISDFVPTNIPRDVKEVEILFKESNSDNVYIVKNIKRGSSFYQANGTTYDGFIVIDSEIFGSTLPSSQLTRIFDGVPKKAVSQEFSSSRLLFGNYTEGYNLLDGNLQEITPSIKQFFDTTVYPDDFKTTIFSANIIDVGWAPNIEFTYPYTTYPIPPGFLLGEQWNSDYKWTFPSPSNQVQHGRITKIDSSFASTDDNIDVVHGGSITDKSVPIVNCGINAYIEGPSGDPGSNYDNTQGHFIDNDINQPKGPFYTAPHAGSYTFKGTIEVGYNDIMYSESTVSSGTLGDYSYTSELFNIALCIAKCDTNGVPNLTANDFEQAGNDVTGGSDILSPTYRPRYQVKNQLNSNVILARGTLTRPKALNYGGRAFSHTTTSIADENDPQLLTLSDTGGASFVGGVTLNLPETTVQLAAGEIICFCIPYPYSYVSTQDSFDPVNNIQQSGGVDITDDLFNGSCPSDANFGFQSRNASLQITSAPSTEIEVVAQQAYESVKSSRTYQTGIVYLDDYGRESTVLIDESQIQGLPKDKCDRVNRVRLSIKNNAPYWAKYYKVFIKEIAKEYYNIPLYKAYPVDQDNESLSQFVWLAFSSNERNKVKLEDALVLKKEHGTNNAVTDANASWRILDIVDTPRKTQDDPETEDIDETAFSLGALTIPATAEEIDGKFFVKIMADTEVAQYLEETGDADQGLNSTEKVGNGAVFEVETPRRIDLDLFYEISQAYPIYLNEKDAKMYIKKGNKLNLKGPGQEIADLTLNGFPNISNAAQEDWQNYKPSVLNVFGAESKDGYCKISLSEPLPSYITASNNNPLKVYFYTGDGIFTTRSSYVSAYVTSTHVAGTSTLEIYPFTHPVTYSPLSLADLDIRLPWFNCYAFGNGVESDRIRDDFNAGVLYPYSSVGKQSGFKASLADADYAEVTKQNDIIFSQIYNEESNVSRYNEFLLAEDITKKLNSEYGSIQKLYTRQGDVIAFCESKVIKILANKDALFNADGNQQLLSSTAVLGQAIPFVGDYGISKNPESFAVEEYRIYFTDRDRGAVCRLSRDGITAISNAGMTDWFNDNLINGQALIGSYDGKKNEYNITIHSVVSSGNTKNVYTLSFSEDSKGWTSFKSFTPESGESLSNSYYTFKSGKMWLHHPNSLSEDRCNFYGTQNTSTLTALFNEASGSVKLFKTVNYEGTQSKEL